MSAAAAPVCARPERAPVVVRSWTSPVSSSAVCVQTASSSQPIVFSEMRMQVVSPLLLLLLGLWARSRPGARGQQGAGRQCPQSKECRKQEQCPAFSRQREELGRLPLGSAEYEALLERLKAEVCDRASKRVCCQPVSREISGGDGYTDPHEFPFMVRITVTVNT